MNWTKAPYIHLLVVSGNIGVGKSTLLESLPREKHAKFDVEVIPEALFDFTNYGNFNPLALMYENPEENFGFFQLHVIRSMNKHFRRYIGHLKLKYRGEAAPSKQRPLFIVTDRSLFAPIVFIENARCKGTISPFVASFLSSECWYHATESYSRANVYVRGVFFLDPPLEQTKLRISSRGRLYEKDLDDIFLNDLRAHYIRHLEWWKLNSAVIVRTSAGSTRESAVSALISLIEEILAKED